MKILAPQINEATLKKLKTALKKPGRQKNKILELVQSAVGIFPGNNHWRYRHGRQRHRHQPDLPNSKTSGKKSFSGGRKLAVCRLAKNFSKRPEGDGGSGNQQPHPDFCPGL